MERLVITIRPAPSDEALLTVDDAMQQVIDYIKLFEAAQRSLGNPHEDFVWRLERASASSPFTVVARADARNPSVDVSAEARRVKAMVAGGLRSIIQQGVAPTWVGEEETRLIRDVFARNQNGIGRTDIDLDEGRDVLVIDPPTARAGNRAIEAINVLQLENELFEREAFGEIEGVMIAAGRYRRRPAISLRTEYYGFVWCILSEKLQAQFGTHHTVAEIWEGKSLGVQGVLHYGNGGRLLWIDAVDIREIEEAPPIDLDSVLDPDFTSGLDPHEYLRKLHEGELG